MRKSFSKTIPSTIISCKYCNLFVCLLQESWEDTGCDVLGAVWFTYKTWVSHPCTWTLQQISSHCNIDCELSGTQLLCQTCPRTRYVVEFTRYTIFYHLSHVAQIMSSTNHFECKHWFISTLNIHVFCPGLC